MAKSAKSDNTHFTCVLNILYLHDIHTLNSVVIYLSHILLRNSTECSFEVNNSG